MTARLQAPSRPTYDDLKQLTAVAYSDTTFTYDRLGRQKVAQTFLSAQHCTHDPATLALTNEIKWTGTKDRPLFLCPY